MEKQRQIKILSIVALVLAISAMTLGFAAFSTTLNISSSASVTPNSSNFSVKFSTEQNSLVEGDVEPYVSGSDVVASKGKIVNGASPTLTNLSVSFTKPGQYVTYNIYVRNEGEYTAYLNNVNFIGEKTCVADSDATSTFVNSACNDITIAILHDLDVYKENKQITNQPLEKGSSEFMTIRILYDGSGTPVDGSFKITFPSISLVYSTVDDSSMSGRVVRLVSGDINTIGSVVAIGNEQFYVIGKENGNVKLLSMYNLYVGEMATPYPYEDADKGYYHEYEEIPNPTGIQSSDARGAYCEVEHTGGEYECNTKWYGITRYTNEESIGNVSYERSIVKGYIDNYKAYLTNVGANIISARLITGSELYNLGCYSESCSSAPSWVYQTSYYAEQIDKDAILFVKTTQESKSGWYQDGDYLLGVRPVIEIPIS